MSVLAEANEIQDNTAQLAAGTSVNARDENGFTMIMVAALNDFHNAAKILLEQHGADPNITDRDGYRPLHFPADARIVELLLKHGADVNAQNNIGETPLMIPFRFENVELVRILLRNGASLSHRNDEGLTALERAKCRKQIERTREARGLPKFPGDWQETIDLLTAVTNAGSWERYLREPVVQLLSLRHLCLAGRATAPPTLVRCFGAPPVPNAGKARTRARRVAAATPLPDEVFALILSFWHWRT